MKKFIFYQLKSIQEHCLTFSCCCQAGFSKFNFTVLLYRLSKLGFSPNKLLVSFILLFSLFTGVEIQAQVLRGVVPVQNPAGGSGVDGDAFANYKIPPSIYGTVGDLFYDPINYPGPGRGVLDAGGVPITPLLTFFLRDPFDIDPNGTGDPTVFDWKNRSN